VARRLCWFAAPPGKDLTYRLSLKAVVRGSLTWRELGVRRSGEDDHLKAGSRATCARGCPISRPEHSVRAMAVKVFDDFTAEKKPLSGGAFFPGDDVRLAHITDFPTGS
jgi:hypothetical protein